MRYAFLFLLLFSQASALSVSSDTALLKADSVFYDDTTKSVEAVGHVEIYSDGRTLLSPKVTYFFEKDVVNIKEDSQILEQDGRMIALQEGALSEKMTEGFAKSIRILLGPTTRLAAKTGELHTKNKIVLHNAHYSPCKLCRFPGIEQPLWQMHAQKITYDKEDKMVYLKNAWLEFESIPLFYTPYFFYPVHEKERQSGFLLPEHTTSKHRHMIGLPYYYTFSPQHDMTLKPIFSFNNEQLLHSEYRGRFEKASLFFNGSFGRVDAADNDYRLQLPTFTHKDARQKYLKDKHQLHGHINSSLAVHHNDLIRSNLHLHMASNKTYLQRYRFSDRANVLTSRAYSEMFDGNHYATMQGFYFQGLRSFDRQRDLPQLLPLIQSSYMHDLDHTFIKGALDFKTDMAFTQRINGPHSDRASLMADWNRDIILPLGLTSSLYATTRYDQYFIPAYKENGTSYRQKDLGRIIPLTSANLAYPLVNIKDWATFTLEPTAQITFTPLLTKSRKKMPNIDSEGFELDETSLFSEKRFAGFDRFFDGSHLDYGLKGRADFTSGPFVDAFIGQGYHFENKNFGFKDLGFVHPFTDYVGKLAFSPLRGLTFSERFRVDAKTYEIERNEVSATYSISRITVGAKHIYLRENSTLLNIAPRNELQNSLALKINDYWRLQGNATFAFNQKASASAPKGQKFKPLNYGAGLFYEDECFLINGNILRDETVNQTRKAGVNTFLHFSFKPGS